jgi:predicted TIM-barrel fold metal-dependent hydrolase
MRWNLLVTIFALIFPYSSSAAEGGHIGFRAGAHLAMETSLRVISLLFLCFLSALAVGEDRPPVIDVHMHAYSATRQGPPPVAICTPMQMPAWDPVVPYPQLWLDLLKNPHCEDPLWSPKTDDALRSETISAMEKRNIFGVLSGTPELVAQWMQAAPGRFLPGLEFSLGREEPTVEAVEQLHQDGKLAVLAEVTNQYVGITPDDKRMTPYWELAERLDIPVGIHIGTGPPGVIYLGSDGYRARLHSALTLEEMLVQHPGLRVYIMHAGYPMLDDLLAVMYAHPQVYIGVGIIVSVIPRPAFYGYLEGVFQAGFGKRVMFGSDQMVWPGLIERSIQVIEEAPFLSDEQKRDIFYNNAARFLRLSDDEIARQRSM